MTTNDSNLFWTNDEPGFSCNVPFTEYFNQIGHNIRHFNYIVLSPDFCLKLDPNPEDWKEKLYCSNKLFYEEVKPNEYTFIMEGVFKTRNQLLIAQNKKLLLKYTRVDS